MQFPLKYKSDGGLNLQLLDWVREQTIYGHGSHQIFLSEYDTVLTSILGKQSETILMSKTFLPQKLSIPNPFPMMTTHY